MKNITIVIILSCLMCSFGWFIYTEKQEHDYVKHLWAYSGWLNDANSKIKELKKELKAKDREKICLLWYPYTKKIGIEYVLGGGEIRPLYYRRDVGTKLDSVSIYTVESLILYLKKIKKVEKSLDF